MSEHSAHQDVNPDPARYRRRRDPTFSLDASEALGIVQSWWEPRDGEYGSDDGDDDDDYVSGLWRKPALALSDLDGYRPLRLVFGLPHAPPGREFSDDWYDVLFSTLFAQTSSFGALFFGEVSGEVSGDCPHSPWGDALPPALLFYCSDVARADGADGGWDALLLDPVQRAAVVRGVLAKVLDEHVFAALLFGCSAEQQDVLSHMDRAMLKSEGYARKLKRCEQVQAFLGADTLTRHFWADVDRVTAQAAQMLLPLINMQRQMLIRDIGSSDNKLPDVAAPPGLCTFYQQLHDIVALAGYAAVNMARSVCIFDIAFPEPGQLWDVDQNREADDTVYLPSLSQARAEDLRKTLAGAYTEGPAPLRAAKIKIVAWPRITRHKPVWSPGRDRVTCATRTVITKSSNVYYCGVAGESGKSDEDEEPELYEYVALVRAARRAAGRRAVVRLAWLAQRWTLALYVVLLLWTGLRVWHREGRQAAQHRLVAHAEMLAAPVATAGQVIVDAAVTAGQVIADAAATARGQAGRALEKVW